MLEGLTFRKNYFDDPASLQGLSKLLQDIFGIDIGILQQLGGFDPSSMPFGYFDDTGRCVANFSAFSMPIIIDGEGVNATGYQSGAVRPEFRGKGLYRELMQEAFSWAEMSGSDTGMLLTDKPSIYEKFGFKTLPQYKFCGPMPDFKSIGGQSRQLGLTQAEDLVIIKRAFDTRQPVSKRFSVVRQKEMFLFNASLDPLITLSYIPDLQAVIAWKVKKDSCFVLLDIVAPTIPALRDILSNLNPLCENLEVHFPTDLLGWKGDAVTYQSTCSLMISGRSEGRLAEAGMLSPLADF